MLIAMKRIINALFVLLGFGATSCEKTSNEVPSAYGVPYAEYNISARVVTQGGYPIKKLHVLPSQGDLETNYGTCETTDINGVVNLIGGQSNLPKYVKFVDVDGDANAGYFGELILNIEDKYEKIDEGGGWCTGRYKAELGDIVLQAKEQTNNE